MFGKSIEQAAGEYLQASYQEKQRLRPILLKDPAKSAAYLLLSGIISLRNYSRERLTTSYRNAPSYLYDEAMSQARQVTEGITEFVTLAGGEAIMAICRLIKSKEAPIAIQACFVLLNINSLSSAALQELDYSLHHLNSALPEKARVHVGGLAVCVQAQNNFGQAYSVLQREAQKKGSDWREVTHNFIASGYDFILIPGRPDMKSEPKIQEQLENNSNDAAAAWYAYYTFWDPDNAPWNHD